MISQNDIINEYYTWLSEYISRDRFSENVSYDKLLMFLHSKKFRSLIQRDENRAEDGISLRYRFALDLYPNDVDMIMSDLDGPCSVLEMLVALAIRCEEDIMDDPQIGNRTKQWFWGMIVNLGLGSMNDRRFNKKEANDIIESFLNRDYAPDGKGGLFTIRESVDDLRDVEIWVQMLWYLDTIC